LEFRVLQTKMKELNRNQSGFTLVEMLVVVVLIGLISTGITASIMQLLTINTRSSNHMIAVRQVQQAGKEVSKDGLQAQPSKIDDSPSGGEFLILGWTDWEGLENEVIYTIEGGELYRSHTVDGEPVSTGPPFVARYIDPDETSCVWASGVLTFTVTATVSGGPQQATETRVYEIEPRPS